MSKYDSVGVMGGGSWGTTLAHLLGKNGHNTLLWLRDKNILEEINNTHYNKKYTKDFLLSENVKATDNIEKIAKHCKVIVLAIPSKFFRHVAYQLGNYTKGDQILLSACKGLEIKTYSRMTSVLAEETCCKKIGVLAGPNLFEEIMRGYPSATVISSRYHEVINEGCEVFSSELLRVYGNEDIIGVELGGAIKNVIAIAAGIMDGLGFGNNSKSLLVTRGIAEMRRVGIKLGADSLTFSGLTGVGDTMVTCSGNLSRNYRVGYHLAQGKKLESILDDIVTVAEGVPTAKALYEFAQNTQIEIPIIEGVYQILYENKTIREIISGLMSRKVHWEIDKIYK